MNALRNSSICSRVAELTRLASYRAIGDNLESSLSYSELARAGFLYNADTSTVSCHCCGHKLDILSGNVDPKNASHHKVGCIFVNGGDESYAENSYNEIETDGGEYGHDELNLHELTEAGLLEAALPAETHGSRYSSEYGHNGGFPKASTNLTRFNTTCDDSGHRPAPANDNNQNSEESSTLSQSSPFLESTQGSTAHANVPTLPHLTSPDSVSDYSSECPDTHFYDDENFEVECDKSEHHRNVSVHRTNCDKNPGHYAYFSTSSVTPEQIPSAARNELFLTFLKLVAFLTVRIHVSYTSHARPQEDLSGKTAHREDRYGTGFVFEDPSSDDEVEPQRSTEPPRSPKYNVFKKFVPFLKKTKSGHVYVYTNRHLVFDKAEAIHTTVDFFYDSPDGRNVVSVKGEFVLFSRHPANSQVVLVCRCTDLNLITQIGQTKRQLLEIAEQLPRRTKRCLTKKLFIIHHPHGGEKVLSYGDSVLGKFALRSSGAAAAGNDSLKLFKITSQQDVPVDLSMCRKALLYAADTCMGSSGAPVISFRKEGQGTTSQYILDMWMHNGVDKVHKLGASVLKVCSVHDFASSSRPGQIVGQPSSSTETVDSDSDEEEGQGSEHVTSPVFKVLTHPSYPAFIAYHKRRESFTNWTYEILSPENLALAGFFYAGYADCVRCFQCGLGLRSWKAGDDVYAEHTKHRPNCPYLQVQVRLGLVNGVHSLESTSSASTGNVSMIEEDGENINTREYHAINHDPDILSTDSGVGITSEEPRGHMVLNLLKKENNKLREQLTCKVCFRATVKDLFLPCGELYACTECSKLLTHCPSCNRQILATVTIYFT